MGGGSVYLLRPGKQTRRKDLVDMFAPAPLDRLGTVARQDKNYRSWLDGLR